MLPGNSERQLDCETGEFTRTSPVRNINGSYGEFGKIRSNGLDKRKSTEIVDSVPADRLFDDLH